MVSKKLSLGFSKIIGKEQSLEVPVVLQKSPYKISLVPCPTLLEPILRVFKGKEDIMDMNDHPRLEPREDFEEDMIHITPHFANMGGIDKEKIIGPELIKKLDSDILHGLFY